MAAISDPWEQLERVIARSLTGYQPDAPEGGRLWIESWHFGIRDRAPNRAVAASRPPESAIRQTSYFTYATGLTAGGAGSGSDW